MGFLHGIGIQRQFADISGSVQIFHANKTPALSFFFRLVAVVNRRQDHRVESPLPREPRWFLEEMRAFLQPNAGP
jgi:hypothetical protein